MRKLREAMLDVVAAMNQQLKGMVADHTIRPEFEREVQLMQRRRQIAREALLAHVAEHGC